jgi:hypothetical protein
MEENDVSCQNERIATIGQSVSVYRRDRTQGRSRLVRYLEFILSMAFTMQHEPQKNNRRVFYR